MMTYHHYNYTQDILRLLLPAKLKQAKQLSVPLKLFATMFFVQVSIEKIDSSKAQFFLKADVSQAIKGLGG